MAPLFSKRLSCFYCGGRSAQPNKLPVRKWQCKHCEAVNYLDEVRHLFSAISRDTTNKATLSRMEKLQILLLPKQTQIRLHPARPTIFLSPLTWD